jgi:anti-sigma-K factor RskA
MSERTGMSCEELQEMFELYALGLLETEERDEIDEHLARGCADCRRNLNAALAMNSTLLGLAPDAAPSKNLKRKIVAMVGGKESAGWGSMAALIAAACMLALAVWMGVQERQKSDQLADARRTVSEMKADRDHVMAALSFLNQPETQEVGFGKNKPAHGNVFVNPERGVLLLGSNMPMLPAGKMFEMWVIPKGGAPRPAGMFQAVDGSSVHMFAGSVDPATIAAIAVTIEPEAGSAAPTSEPFIVAPVAGL